MTFDFQKEFVSLWENLAISNHIVQGLKKSMNSKQSLDLARRLKTELQTEILHDLKDWYMMKKAYGDEIDHLKVREDIMHRINAELAKYNVPLLSYSMLR